MTDGLRLKDDERIDLHREMDVASDACPPRRILSAGIDWDACMASGGIGIVRGEVFRDGSYQPVDEGGSIMWALPCFCGAVNVDQLVDIVAWHPENPEFWSRRTGMAGTLGHPNIIAARRQVWDFGRGDAGPTPPTTIHLHRTPKNYALAGFTGAVVLDWQGGLYDLTGIDKLHCGRDIGLAEELDRRLKVDLPTVIIDDMRETRAA